MRNTVIIKLYCHWAHADFTICLSLFSRGVSRPLPTYRLVISCPPSACSGNQTSPLCASSFLYRIQGEPLQTYLYLSGNKAHTSPSANALLGGHLQPLLTPGSNLVVGLVLLNVHPCGELPAPFRKTS